MDILPQLIVNGIIAGSFYALIALAFNLMYATAKFFNIALAALIPVGGYTAFLLIQKFHAPLVVAALGGALCAGGAGLALDALVFTRLRARKASPLVLIIASLGAGTALQALLAILFTSQLQLLAEPGQSSVVTIGTASFTQLHIVVAALALLATATVHILLSTTSFGRAVRAVSDDAEVAAIVGIDTNAVIQKVFFFASALAGFAGVLIGLDHGIEPTMGMFYFLSGVIGSIVGGIGSIIGGYAGSLVEGLVENIGIWSIGTEWKNAIAFVLLIAVLLIRPRGLFKLFYG